MPELNQFLSISQQSLYNQAAPLITYLSGCKNTKAFCYCGFLWLFIALLNLLRIMLNNS